MSTITTTTPVTLHDWDTDWSRRDDAYELVRGNPVMPPPTEAFGNVRAVHHLSVALSAALPADLLASGPMAVHLGGGADRPTIRIPDLLVVRAGVAPGRHRLDAADVAFVAEVVSPGSARTDRIDKRHEYAAAGIPTYLLVDVRDPAHPTLTHYELRDGTYPDASPDGEAALVIDGTRVSIRATSLVDRLSTH